MSFFLTILIPRGGVILLAIVKIFVSVKFVQKRAVGALGIVIAGLGLFGEAYQFATQLLT